MKKIVYVLIGVILTFTLLTSVSAAANDSGNPLKIWFHNSNGKYQVLEVHDDITGVNYVVVSRDYYDNSCSVAICPRYNADGSLYVN